MQRKFSLLVVVLSVLVLYVCAQDPEPSSDTPRCYRGEVYKHCGSSCTEPKCNPDNTMICPRCFPGCFCMDGFARNHYGVCVPRYMCEYENF
uniref:TIL domain-containing protein n=1 Tax=Anopheles funestus TaxID=62324 RepID=A0A182RUI9_ANOFN